MRKENAFMTRTKDISSRKKRKKRSDRQKNDRRRKRSDWRIIERGAFWLWSRNSSSTCVAIEWEYCWTARCYKHPPDHVQKYPFLAHRPLFTAQQLASATVESAGAPLL
mmetsp:Transcript_24525/g.39323  ORF Transcript_24525/g.39323 Transcript_24525/m.39323 type:complete len:109 (+) Transcript_24525:1548-1874(+)